jgi:hypothetical protein
MHNIDMVVPHIHICRRARALRLRLKQRRVSLRRSVRGSRFLLSRLV